MFTMTPSIDFRIAKLAPDFRALSIIVEASPIVNPNVATDVLNYACKSLVDNGVCWSEAHIAAWANVFMRFGAKPKRTPCSAEALRKRVLRDGSIPSIDPVVDLYNAISIQYAIPVGGENLACYVGTPNLTIADGTEIFDTIKDGDLVQEFPEQGEVVWRDDKGVTCRRWNWRQGVRTRLSAEARQMWFILESLSAMPVDALHEAGDTFIESLQRMMPHAVVEKKFISVDL